MKYSSKSKLFFVLIAMLCTSQLALANGLESNSNQEQEGEQKTQSSTGEILPDQSTEYLEGAVSDAEKDSGSDDAEVVPRSKVVPIVKKADSTEDDSVSKYNFIFYFLYKYKYDQGVN